MKYIKALFTFLLITAIHDKSFAQKNNVALSIFDTTQFQLSYNKRDIAATFSKHFKQVYHQELTLANPDQDYYKFHWDGPGLPKMHLIVASKGVQNGLGFVYYETIIGGMELRSYLHITTYNGKRIAKEIVLQMPNETRDYAALKKDIKEQRFKLIFKN